MASVEGAQRPAAFRRAIDNVSDRSREELGRAAPRARAAVLAERDKEPTATTHHLGNAIANGPARHSDAVQDDDLSVVDLRRGHAVGPPLHDPEGGSIADPERAREEHGP
jgi:hypothetical protein